MSSALPVISQDGRKCRAISANWNGKRCRGYDVSRVMEWRVCALNIGHLIARQRLARFQPRGFVSLISLDINERAASLGNEDRPRRYGRSKIHFDSSIQSASSTAVAGVEQYRHTQVIKRVETQKRYSFLDISIQREGISWSIAPRRDRGGIFRTYL